LPHYFFPEKSEGIKFPIYIFQVVHYHEQITFVYGETMKNFRMLMAALFFMIVSPFAKASLNLNVKIGQIVGSQIVEINKTISADYNKEIVIAPEGLKNKIVFSLRKFSNVLVNGKRINPVQIDMKIVDEMKKIIGKPQTITSFYSKSAQFAIPTNGQPQDQSDLNVTLHFEETN